MERIVFHLDMDAFFAAVEERDHPEFRGFPVVVGADPEDGRGRGVVSTANYEARKYGIRSAMPISRAWQLCQKEEISGRQKCVFFRGNFEKYARESEKVMAVARGYAEKFEQVGVDEAYLELEDKGYGIGGKETKALAQKLKQEICQKTKLTCSVGVGPNKLIAKIASDAEKPNGLTIVKSHEARAFLDPLPVRAIPGIGPKTEIVLRALNVATIKDLRLLSMSVLEKHFGAWGKAMFKRARGEDDRPVGEFAEAKSLGRQTTFPADVRDPATLMEALRALAREVADDVRAKGVKFKNIELAVRFENFETKTRQKTLVAFASDVATIERTAIQLFLPFLDRRENPRNLPVRLLGIRAKHFQNG